MATISAPNPGMFDPSDLEKIYAQKLSSDPYNAIGMTGAILDRENQGNRYLNALREGNALTNMMGQREGQVKLREAMIQHGPNWIKELGLLPAAIAPEMGMPTYAQGTYASADQTNMMRRLAEIAKTRSETVKNMGDAAANSIVPQNMGSPEQMLEAFKRGPFASVLGAQVKAQGDIMAAREGRVTETGSLTVEPGGVRYDPKPGSPWRNTLEAIRKFDPVTAEQIEATQQPIKLTRKFVDEQMKKETNKGSPPALDKLNKGGPADTGKPAPTKPDLTAKPIDAERILRLNGLDPATHEVVMKDGVPHAKRRTDTVK